MGFVSPATDYAEGRLTLDSICGLNATTGIIQTSSGYAVVDTRPSKIEPECTVLISFCGRTQFAKVRGQAFITDDGEAIEGEAVEEVTVMGLVTYFLNRAGDDDTPVI